MKVIKSKRIGFCRGVSLAINKMYSAIEWGKKNNVPVYSLGKLIHNDRSLYKFEELGVSIVEEQNLESVKPGIIVLRAHGVKDSVIRKLLNLGFIVVDATCPIVIREKDLILKADLKYHIVVIGKKHHPEAIYLYSVETSHSKSLVTCVEDVKKIDTDKPLFVVIQSTFPQTKAETIYNEIKKILPNNQEMVVANKLCSSTRLRRDAISVLAKEVDCIIIIGGKNSSNTEGLRLYANNFNKPTFLINSKEEIPDEIYDYSCVGIATGTSTPNFIIDEIVNTLRGEKLSET